MYLLNIATSVQTWVKAVTTATFDHLFWFFFQKRARKTLHGTYVFTTSTMFFATKISTSKLCGVWLTPYCMDDNFSDWRWGFFLSRQRFLIGFNHFGQEIYVTEKILIPLLLWPWYWQAGWMIIKLWKMLTQWSIWVYQLWKVFFHMAKLECAVLVLRKPR